MEVASDTRIMSSTRRISRQEWKSHSATIVELYYERKLPLKSKQGKANVMDIMEREHKFSASAAQYEAFFRTQNRPKNLKNEELRAVCEKADELRLQGMETRITMSGRELDKSSLKRRRRYAMTKLRGTKSQTSQLIPVPIPACVRIEAIKPCEHTSAHASDQIIASTWPSPPLIGPSPTSFEDMLSVEGIMEHVPPHNNNNNALSVQRCMNRTQTNSPLPLHGFTTMSPYQDNFFFSASHWLNTDPTSASLNNLLASSPRLLSYFQPLQSPFQQFLAILPSKSRQVSHPGRNYSNLIISGQSNIHALNRTPQPISTVSVNLHLQELFMDAGADELPIFNNLLEDIKSLFADTQSMDDPNNPFHLSDGDSSTELVLQRALLFSITNGFSGLQNVPPIYMLKILKKQPQIYDFLHHCSLPLVRSLAYNLFRAAVEACDEEALKAILAATQKTPNEIPLDDIICQHKGKRYTPVELAALCRHLGIVVLLLAAKVDMNKTYEDRYDPWRGPLELAIISSKFEACDQIDNTLLLKLLESSPKIRTSLITSVLARGNIDVAQELLRRVPLPNHPQRLEHVELLVLIADLLPNAFVSEFIQNYLIHCQSETCSATKGAGDFPEMIERILWQAALRGNIDLVKCLLQYSNQRGINVALTAAVMNGTAEGHELVELLFKRGASVDKETIPLDRNNQYVYTKKEGKNNIYSRTTVLAEAIRQKQDDLVQLFEGQGALFHLKSPNHFVAAIDAAAGNGDSDYMQKLFKYAPENYRHLLDTALEASMRIGKTETILLLLEAGAVNHYQRFSSMIIQMAISNRNETVLEKLLDLDCNVSLTRNDWKRVMDWGDFNIVKDLVLMSPADQKESLTDALEAAVGCANVKLVNFLIEHGANINRHINRHEERGFEDDSSPKSPLAAAIANEDRAMTELLLVHGADPADWYAFSEALNKHQELFPALLQRFREQHPNKKLGFGADSLIEAILNNDTARFSLMLEAGFDVNALTLFDKHDKRFSPLLFAIGFRNGLGIAFAQQLLNAGADPNRIFFHSRRISYSGIETPLMVAIKTKSEEMVKLLLAYCADVHRPARRGVKRTPLQQACEIGCYNIVMLLLGENADVNEPPAQQAGGTALQFAAISGNIKIFRLLLSRGAVLRAPASRFDGRTALEGAAEHGRLEMITEIWNAARGEGFSQKEIDNAKRFAKENGYLPCADYVATLSSSANFSFVPDDPWMGFGSQ